MHIRILQANYTSSFHPSLHNSQDRRKELSKKVAKMGEDGKVAVRNVRKDAMKRLDKHEFPKDARKALEDSIQKITDKFDKSVDDMVKAKSEELMKV